MKRRVSLIVAGALTAIVLLVTFSLGLTPFMSLSQADAQDGPTQQDSSVSLPVSQVDMAATAQAIQFQNRQAEWEVISQQREAALQAQIAQSRQAITDLDQASQAQLAQRQAALAELDSTAQAQVAQQQAQLADRQSQIQQVTAHIQAAQAHIAELQQALQQDDATYQAEVTAMQTEMVKIEQQLQAQLETTYSQVQAAYNEIANRQVAPSGGSQGPSHHPGGDYEEEEGGEEEGEDDD